MRIRIRIHINSTDREREIIAFDFSLRKIMLFPGLPNKVKICAVFLIFVVVENLQEISQTPEIPRKQLIYGKHMEQSGNS